MFAHNMTDQELISDLRKAAEHSPVIARLTRRLEALIYDTSRKEPADLLEHLIVQVCKEQGIVCPHCLANITGYVREAMLTLLAKIDKEEQ